MTTLLIDGDIILYTSSVATEFSCDWGNDNWVLSANLEQSQDLAAKYIDELIERFDPEELIVCLSDHQNFRYDINPDYKSGRKNTRKPLVYSPLKVWLRNSYQTRSAENLEADDLLGILATSLPDAIVVSPDKDLQTVPCTLYRQGELKTITLEEANRFHMYQTLTGDPTDGYSGCPGVGPKTAEKLLQGNPETHWGVVVQAYEKAGLTEADALLNARMAYILRKENWIDNEVKLWTPTSTA
jgi:DNA polymerase-1